MAAANCFQKKIHFLRQPLQIWDSWFLEKLKVEATQNSALPPSRTATIFSFLFSLLK